MVNLAMSMSDEEIQQAAAYFSAVKWDTRWVRVSRPSSCRRLASRATCSSATGERTHRADCRAHHRGAGRQVQAEQLTQSALGFVAYAPIGSIAAAASW
jgi:hypothetical protein